MSPKLIHSNIKPLRKLRDSLPPNATHDSRLFFSEPSTFYRRKQLFLRMLKYSQHKQLHA